MRPGWLALQQRVGDHVEIRFIPPAHNRSLAGILAGSFKRRFPTEAEMRRARDEAWTRHVEEDMNLAAELPSADESS